MFPKFGTWFGEYRWRIQLGLKLKLGINSPRATRAVARAWLTRARAAFRFSFASVARASNSFNVGSSKISHQFPFGTSSSGLPSFHEPSSAALYWLGAEFVGGR